MTSSKISQNVVIRNLREGDIEKLAHTFTAPWSSFEATLQLWQGYFKEQQNGTRTACVLECHNELLGYGSLLRNPEYPFFRENGIPEVNAIWIHAQSRQQGLGSRLIAHLEEMARKEGYKTIGIGVGLYKDYGPAQKLYFKRGYKPDGNGVTYKCLPVTAGEKYPVDDDLILWFTKPLNRFGNFLKLSFKLVEKKDRSLVHFWLSQPHVAKWFYGQGLENTYKHLDQFLEGSPLAQYWLGFDQDHPFAFFITSHVNKPDDALAKWCSPEGTAITLDMLIGDTSYLGKGHAVQMIHAFLLRHFSDVDEVLIDPEVSNERAVNVYQKAGFSIMGEFIPSHSPHPHYMMKLNLKELFCV